MLVKASLIDGKINTFSLSDVKLERVTTAYFRLGNAPIDSKVLRPTNSHWLYVIALNRSCSPLALHGISGPFPITPFFDIATISDSFTILPQRLTILLEGSFPYLNPENFRVSHLAVFIPCSRNPVMPHI